METIRIRASDARNEMHFEVQRRTRACVYADRRRMEKSGYRKHKGAEWW